MNKFKAMKRIIWTALAVTILGTGIASAQTRAAYFMEGSTLRTQMNPAFAPSNKGYFNIPGIGAVQVNTRGNFGLDALLYPLNDGRLVTIFDKNVSADMALGKLKTQNMLGVDTRVNILGFGAYTGNRRDFWSFDLNLRVNADLNIPESLFSFIKNGDNHAVIENLSAEAEAYVEVGGSYSWRVMDGLYVGARGKFLVGGGRMRMAIDKMTIDMAEAAWTVEGEGSLDAVGLPLRTSRRNDGSEYYALGDFGGNYTVPNGYGFGLDLGATYDVLEDLQVSLAVNDLGMMFWGKDERRTGRMNRRESYAGVEIVDGEPEPVSFNFSDLHFDKIDNVKGLNNWLRTSINAGGEYKLWDRRIGLGLLYNMQLGGTKTYHNIMASATFTPIWWFTLGANYSFLHRGHGVGLAMNICPSWINFFVATDVIFARKTPQWIPLRGTDMNVTFGLGIPIAKKGHRYIKDQTDPRTY